MSLDAPAIGDPAPDPARDLDDVTEVRSLRALTHPVRLHLIEQLRIAGPLTATEAAERIGESPTTCSFHLRQLAKYGFVEEAGGGKGRARPWRMTKVGLRFASTSEDPEFELASGALVRMLRERQWDRYRMWLQTRNSYPPQWSRAAADSGFLFHVTAEELQALTDELVAMLLARYRDRIEHPERRPEGSTAVEMLLLSYPLAPPAQPES
jgi:predicted ArsR family transcriptional regulator